MPCKLEKKRTSLLILMIIRIRKGKIKLIANEIDKKNVNEVAQLMKVLPESN